MEATYSYPSQVGRPRTTTKIKISYDDGGGAGKKKSQQQESRTVQTHADSEAASAVAAANRSLEETWRRRELILSAIGWGGHLFRRFSN